MTWDSYNSHPQNKVIFGYFSNKGRWTSSSQGQAFIFTSEGQLSRVNSLSEHLYSSDWKYNLNEKKRNAENDYQSMQEQAKDAIHMQDADDFRNALISTDLPDKYGAAVETSNNHIEVMSLRNYVQNYSYKGVPERQDTTLLFIIAKKKGKSFGSILADVAVSSLIGYGGGSSNSTSWTVDLKDKDIAALQVWVDDINKNSKGLKFDIAGDNSSGSKYYCGLICYNSNPIVKTEDKLSFSPTLDASCIIGSYTTNPIIQMASDSVLFYNMRKDYLNNKYGVSKEPQAVRNIVEEKLGMKGHVKTAAEKRTEQIAIKQMCKQYGIAYTPNMTENQFKAALQKKYKNNPRALAERLADMMQNLNGIYQEAMGEMFFSGALVNSKESQQADRIISQLKQDHANDIKSISIARKDDLTFIVNFGGSSAHQAEIQYKPSGIFEVSYKIKVLN